MYDYLVSEALDMDIEPDDVTDEIWDSCNNVAEANFEVIRSELLNGIPKKIPVVGVSTGNMLLIQIPEAMTEVCIAEPNYPRSSVTISQLIQITDQEIRANLGSKSHAEPAPLAFAVAQRGDRTTNIDASIE
jgi:hypothetical protein